MGNFSFFFWVNGQRSPKRNLMGQAYGWRQRTPFRVSEIRIRKNRVFSVSVKRSPPDKRHKAGGKRLNLTVNEVENFQGSGHFEVSEASEESEDSWWPERSTPQQVGSSVFFFGGREFFEARFWRPPGCTVFFLKLFVMLGNRYARLIGLDHKGASLWGAVEVQRSSNGFAEFPGEISRSLKILEGVFVWTF